MNSFQKELHTYRKNALVVSDFTIFIFCGLSRKNSKRVGAFLGGEDDVEMDRMRPSIGRIPACTEITRRVGKKSASCF